MLSLRVKLTLYYLAILAAVLLFFGVAIYTYLSRSLLTTIDQSLAFQLEQIEKKNLLATAGGDVLNGDETQALPENLDQLQLAAQIMQVIDSQGQIIEEMSPHPTHRLKVDIAALRRITSGQPKFETVNLPTGESIRTATCHLKDADGDYYIRLGQSLGSLQHARRRLLLVLLIAVPLALLAGSYGGWYLANQALRPVDRLTRAAEHIGAGDLSERVPVPVQQDELGRLAATFNTMIARLQAAFERQRQFTSDASHELRTPLAVMRGDVEITLRRPRPVEEYQRALTSNLEEIVRLQRLVEDLLMLARADAGRVELRCEPVNLAELCQKMTEYITPLAEQREQSLSYEGPAEAVTINADAQRLKQLLLNLLDNAIKYTEPRGQITLRLSREEREAVIRVIDTGRGIPVEDLPHVFERFFRRSAKTSDRSASGSGLGLSIVKWIVDSHGGKIEAESKVGEGTTFTVRFPLADAERGA